MREMVDPELGEKHAWECVLRDVEMIDQTYAPKGRMSWSLLPN